VVTAKRDFCPVHQGTQRGMVFYFQIDLNATLAAQEGKDASRNKPGR
jgi:hypothetical protein